jgi:hypothetical protein
MPDVLYKTDGVKVVNYNKSSTEESNALFDRIKSKFPWFNVDVHRAVSQEYLHEYIGKNVIRTCVMMNYAESVLEGTFSTAHRLFDLDGGTSMFYVTKFFDLDQPSWADEDMHFLCYSEHHEEYGKPCDPKMLEFAEYFFVAPTEKLESMGYDLTDKNDDTVFSVLVANNEIVAKRRYTNFEEGDAGVLANWQTMYVLYAKKARRMDLVRNLFAQPFLNT